MDREKYPGLTLVNSDGLSMWPFFKPGDKLIIEKFSLGEMRIGDIILYKEDARMICHRLVKKIKYENRDMLFAKGDSSFNPSSPIIEENIIGKVAGLIRDNSRIIDLTGFRCRVFNKCIANSAFFVTLGIKIVKYFCLPQKKRRGI